MTTIIFSASTRSKAASFVVAISALKHSAHIIMIPRIHQAICHDHRDGNPAKEALTDGNYWAKKAPALVVVATKNDLACQLSEGRDYALFDCGMATQNLLLQAVKEGAYAHPMAGFDPSVVRKVFDITVKYTVITIVALNKWKP